MAANLNLSTPQYLDKAFDATSETHKVTLTSSSSSGLALESGGNLDTIASDTTEIAGKTPVLGTAAMAASAPVTIASDDTVSVSMGTTADVAVDSDTSGTVIGFLRGLVKIWADVWDSTSSLVKTQDQSQIWTRFVDWDQLVTSAQDLTGAMATMGAVISGLDGYKYLRVPFLLDGNDSRSIQIQVVYEVESGGTLEIPYDFNKWFVRYSELDITQQVRTLLGTVSASLDGWYSVEIELDNAVPAEIKVQVMAGTVGATAGQIDNAYYKKGY